MNFNLLRLEKQEYERVRIKSIMPNLWGELQDLSNLNREVKK